MSKENELNFEAQTVAIIAQLPKSDLISEQLEDLQQDFENISYTKKEARVAANNVLKYDCEFDD